MDKQNAYTYRGILFSHRKDEILTCFTINEAWKHYAKWNQAQKDKYYMIPTYIRYLELEN